MEKRSFGNGVKFVALIAVVFYLSNHVIFNYANAINGTVITGEWTLQWNKEYGGYGHSQHTQPIGDIDGDGINEIIIGGYEESPDWGRARILSYNSSLGTYIEEYSWYVLGGSYHSPSGSTVVDLDDDGDLEFVVSWTDSEADGIYAYDWDGKTLALLDYYACRFVFDVYSCDYDDDGDIEVLIANAPWGGTPYHVMAFRWENGKFVVEATGYAGVSWEAPMLWSGDTDNDGKTEVIVCISDRSFNTLGTWALNWEGDEWIAEPVYTGRFPGSWGTHYGVVVGDVDGDGTPEIGIGNNPRLDIGAAVVLVEWNGFIYEKVLELNWPTEFGVIEALAIGDADNDGANEFVVGGGCIHIIGWNGTNYIEESTITLTYDGLLVGVIVGDCDSDGKNEIKACDIRGYGPGMEWIFKFKIVDVNPPFTLHDYDGKWHTSDFTIKLWATDDASGVKETFYRVNGGLQKRVSVDGYPFISSEGENNTLEYWSVDNAGNEEVHKFLFNIKLDKGPPWGKLVINGDRAFTNSTDVVLEVEYYDNASGVTKMRFSNDGVWDSESWENVSRTKNWKIPPSEGVKTVFCQLMDFVGFVSQTFNSTIILDVSPPKTTYDYDGGWRNKDFYINLTASDNLGKTETFYRINDGAVSNISYGQPLITMEGKNNKLEFWSVDEAGNVEEHKLLFNIKLDKTPPTILLNISKEVVEVGETITLSAENSYDVCSGVAECLWFFGDGKNASGPVVKHSYSQNGTYTLTLRVYDYAANFNETTLNIKVLAKSSPPLIPILSIACISLIIALIGGFLVVKRRKVEKKPTLKENAAEFVTPTSPKKEGVSELVEVETPPLKKLSIEEIDEKVFEYIALHEGTISLSRAAAELGLTLDELKDSINRLKMKGRIG